MLAPERKQAYEARTTAMVLKGITVLGGGLSGLSASFHLSRRFPSIPLILLEKSPGLGGWVRSERVDVNDANGNQARVLLEAGPRTLRPNGKSVLELVRNHLFALWPAFNSSMLHGC